MKEIFVTPSVVTPSAEEIFLTPSAAAREIGKSEGSVRLYAAAGKLPCTRTSTGLRLFRKSDCEEFVRKQGEKT